MKTKEYLELFKRAIIDMKNNPIIVLPGVILWVLLEILGRLSFNVAYNLDSVVKVVSWIAIFVLVVVFIMSFVFSGLIAMSQKAIKKKTVFRDFLPNAKKYAFKNFNLMVLVILISVLISRVSHFGAFYIGEAFELSVDAAKAVFLLIYFGGLIGILLFVSFSSFFLILYNMKVRESLNRSVSFVKKNYLDCLILSIILFVLISLIYRIAGLVGGFIEYVIVVPYVALVVSRFVLMKAKT